MLKCHGCHGDFHCVLNSFSNHVTNIQIFSSPVALNCRKFPKNWICHGNFGRSPKPNFRQARHASWALPNWLKWYSIYNFTPDSPNELANEPNNVWKPGNCIWKVLIGSKMRSSTPGPLKRSRSNLWAQVLIRTSPHKLGLVTAFKSDCNGMECCIS